MDDKKLNIRDFLNKNIVLVHRERAKTSAKLPLIECKITGVSSSGKYLRVRFPNNDYRSGLMSLVDFDMSFDIVDTMEGASKCIEADMDAVNNLIGGRQ